MTTHCCDESVDSELEWVVEEGERGELLRRALAGQAGVAGGDHRAPPALDQARLGALLSGLSAITPAGAPPARPTTAAPGQPVQSLPSSLGHTRPHAPAPLGVRQLNDFNGCIRRACCV